MADADALLRVLRERELALLDPAVRRDRRRLEALLADDFLEFGRSGGVHDKAGVVAALTAADAEDPAGALVTREFAARRLGPDLALLTYRSIRAPGGEALRSDAPSTLSAQHTLRSSIWRRESGQWRLVFHQGTPADDESRGRPD